MSDDEERMAIRTEARVIDLETRRRTRLLGEVYAELQRTDGAPDWTRVREAAAELERGTAPPTPIDSEWTQVPEPWMLEAPPARRWLLRHPTLDGRECPPGRGDGLLPRGKCGCLAAEGGAGKTMALCQMAISIATGRPWLGHWHVGERGRVLLALAEEDAEETHRRLYAATRDLEPWERDLVVDRVVVLPLAGKEVALVELDRDHTIRRTPTHAALVRALEDRGGEEGWALVVIDPLARWAGGDVETSNEGATRLVQAVEALAHVRGTPTVLVAHHSSKGARRAGSVDIRGATGLVDAFRWGATLRADDGAVEFAVAKSNYAIPWDGTLTLMRDRGGVLRVATEAELEERTEAPERARRECEEAAAVEAEARILEVISHAAMPVTSRDQVRELVGGTRGTVNQAFTRLLTSGRVVKRPPNGVEPGRYEVANGSQK